ncbi:MAG: PIN domain-containing protein [Planctomycetota bacterium]
MLLTVLRTLFAFICAGAVAAYCGAAAGAEPNSTSFPRMVVNYPLPSFVVLLLLTQIITFIDILIPKKRLEVISAVYFGLLVGWLLSLMLILGLDPFLSQTSWRGFVQIILSVSLPYICISLLMQTKDDFRFIIPYVEFSREVKGGRPFLLDTSSLIDGRIADILETRIIDSELIVPNFILQELQDIADSSDKMRRNRGRRGLDVLSKLQANTQDVEVRLYEADQKDMKGVSVDQRLVALAKELGGRVVTNDFNLNKVASVQGVHVVNLNDVANALKPRYLPGEQLNLKIIKMGEGPGQGVGYLDDGTMVVCEQGSHLVGRETGIIVTSVLQNSAGRMIFGRPVPYEGVSTTVAGASAGQR